MTAPIHGRPLGAVFLVFASMFAMPASVLAAAAPRAEQVRTVAQDQRGATFEIAPGDARFDAVTVDGTAYTRVGLTGATVLESPGRPALPSLSLHLAIPDGMSPRLRVVAEDWGDRSGAPPIPVVTQRFLSDDPKTGPVSEFKTEPDPVVYRGGALYPALAAELGQGAMVGEWWVAPIRVNTVRWDPRAGAFRVLRKMTVRVDFVAATDREIAARPVSRPGAQARAWDRVQRGLVKNYEAARAFPIRPRTSGLGAKPLPSRARFAVNPEWRLSVSQTGWTSVSYSALAASGFPSGIAIANVRVEERGYDDVGDSATAAAIPVVARDANSNGTFDVGDAITFFGRSLRDRYGTGNIELKYAPDNVYWLTWGSLPAPVPGTVSGVIGGGATTPTSFRDVIRLEENHAAWMFPSTDVTNPPEAVEYLFWTDGQDGDQFQTPIPFVDPDPAQPFRIRARYQGRLTRVHRLDIYFDGAGGRTDTLAFDAEFSDVSPFQPPVYLLDTGFTIPGSHIGGANRYRHVGTNSPNPPIVPFSDPSRAHLDVIEATYNRPYRAQGNVLRFTSGGAGGVFEITVDGFTSSAIEVYDVTDPLSPLRIPDVTVSPTNPYSVRFRTDASSGERRFIAVVPGSENALAAASVIADAPSDLRVPGAYDASKVARTILITPEAFFTEASRLADYRRAQGYVVEVAKIQDVYDEFNGGLKSPRAIRRYIRHGYLSWSPRPTYVVLAGDASLDYKHEIPSSGVDWIPTYMRFEEIVDLNGREQVAQDPFYYAMDLASALPNSGAVVPNVALARIPAGSAQELAGYIDKVIAYENFAPGDSWRGRQFLFADDQYSTGISASQPYCFVAPELEFEEAIQDVASIAAQSPGGIGIQNDFFYLRTYTDAVPPNGSGCKSQNTVVTTLGQIGGGNEQLRNELSQGAGFVSMQTHGNRYIVAHEDVLCGSSGIYCSSANNPDVISNVGKPFYLMIWGCHTNQFPDNGVTGRDIRLGPVDSTDALGEQFLFEPNRGSIASLGSSSLEFLQTNHVYSNFVTNAFYTAPPTPDPAPGQPEQARWILGEVMLEGQIANATSGSPASTMTRTSHLFADPMLRMDALAPRAAQVMVDSAVIQDHGSFTSDLTTGNATILADLRDEVGIDSVYITEQDAAGGPVLPVDTASYSVVYSDSSRVARLTANIRPRVANYDVQIRSLDINGRASLFSLEVRTPIRYFADGVEIVNNVFVSAGAVLRAEVTSPIPVTADSLELVLDGAVVPSTKTQLDTAGRVWRLQAQGVLSTGTHTIQVAVSGRTAGFDQRTFQTTNEFTIRGVAVVDPRVQGAGCGGSIFQYELSAAARKVELLLMTVAGRRVASIKVPGQAGLNVYCWDGRDSQSHDTAQGVYLYRIRATDVNGKTTSKDGRLIRAR